MEHTKTPWKKVKGFHNPHVFFQIQDLKGKGICNSGTTKQTKTQVEDDVDFIVRCVNAHEKLVAALKNLAFFRNGQRCWCESGWDNEKDGHQGQCKAAREALALAEK